MSKSDVFHLGLTKTIYKGLRLLSSPAILSVWKRSPR